MKKSDNVIYTDWLLIYFSYYQLLEVREALFELGVPLIVSVICTAIYIKHNKGELALHKHADIFPSITSIMIGFTVALITILLTSGSESLNELKKQKSKKRLNGKSITLFQVLHVQFSYLLLIEVLLLLVLLFYLYLTGIACDSVVENVFLFFEVFLLMSILFCIVRSITNLHFAFFDGSRREGDNRHN